jgi:hypothetical protein
MPPLKPVNMIWGYMSIVGGILIELVIGNLYLWGNITEYLVSYYHYKGDEKATP